MPRAVLATVALAAADAATLCLLRGAPLAALRGARAPHAWFASAGADGAVATLAAAALWVTAAWLAVGLLCATAARLPGAAGACSRAAARVLLPRLVLRLVAGSLGLGVLLAPVAAAAHPPRPTPPGTATVAAPAWPSSTTTARRSEPAPRWPVAHPHTHHERRPARPVSSLRPGTYRVRAGDSLWLLAARRLGPGASDVQISAEWRRWYAANRALVGADPDLIVPGQVLHAPTATGTPAAQEER